MAAARVERNLRFGFRTAFEARGGASRQSRERVFVDRNQRIGVAAGLVGDPFCCDQLSQLALRVEIHSAHDRVSVVAHCRCSSPAKLLVDSRRDNFAPTLVRNCAGGYRTRGVGETGGAI